MRLKELDFLRGIAIILVLFHHYSISAVLHKIGWSGVDLFFVLSGFLVSGLLFAEYRKYKSINAKLFLIRRGFKIYPAFYTMILVSFLLDLLCHTLDRKQLLRYLCEITFTQNYTSAVWGQTWSLAVEEHFYFFLIFAAVIYLSIKKHVSLKEISIFCSFFFIACLLLRFYTYRIYPEYSYRLHHFPTHLRIDSLLFGVLLAAFYHTATVEFNAFFTRYTPALLLFSAACISITFFYNVESYFMSTAGFTILYLGYGTLLAVVVANKKVVVLLKRLVSERLFNLVAWVGMYSYTIYLYHMLFLKYLRQLFVQPGHTQSYLYFFFIVFFLGSIGIGYAASRLIEQPFLRLREKFFAKK